MNTQLITIEIVGDNPDFAEEARVRAVTLINAMRPAQPLSERALEAGLEAYHLFITERDPRDALRLAIEAALREYAKEGVCAPIVVASEVTTKARKQHGSES